VIEDVNKIRIRPKHPFQLAFLVDLQCGCISRLPLLWCCRLWLLLIGCLNDDANERVLIVVIVIIVGVSDRRD